MRNSLSISENIKENKALEELWGDIFWNEYKVISTSMLKIDREGVNTYIKALLSEYSIWDENVIKIKDQFDKAYQELTNPSQILNISYFESLSAEMKMAMSNFLLYSCQLSLIEEVFWVSMLIRLRCYETVELYKLIELSDRLEEITLMGSKDNDKVLFYARSWNLEGWNEEDWWIKATVKLFQIGKMLPIILWSPEIRNYIQESLWEGFSVSPLLWISGTTPLEWEDKHVTNNGEEIDKNILKNDVKEMEQPDGSTEVLLNRQSHNLSKDFSGKNYNIFLDAPFWFLLYKDNNPLAILTFSLKDEKTLHIHQIQAIVNEYFDTRGRMVKKSIDPLCTIIPWKETLYDIAEKIAKTQKLDYIQILGAENNQWVKNQQLSLENAKRIYDALAKENDFIQQEDKDWKKKIGTVH